MNEKTTPFSRKTHPNISPYPLQTQQTIPLSQTKNQLCIQHSQPIEYLCFSCSNYLLCAQCIVNLNHQHHDVKNLERSSILIRGQLQEWSIRLQQKCQILAVINDRLRHNRAHIFEQAQRYKEKVAAEFSELNKKIEEQLDSIIRSITDFADECRRDEAEKANLIALRQIEIKSMIEENREKLMSNLLWIQAQHYHNNFQTVSSLLQDGEIAYYKQLIVEPIWGIEYEHFKEVMTAISKLKVNFRNSQFANKDYEEYKAKEVFVKSAKKPKKQLKLNNLDKPQKRGSKNKPSNNNNTKSLATFTPKNMSRQKRIPWQNQAERTLLKKKKKSTSKIISLPASPTKHLQKEPQLQPSASKKGIFKKK